MCRKDKTPSTVSDSEIDNVSTDRDNVNVVLDMSRYTSKIKDPDVTDAEYKRLYQVLHVKYILTLEKYEELQREYITLYNLTNRR